jgi:hypothetical protein
LKDKVASNEKGTGIDYGFIWLFIVIVIQFKIFLLHQTQRS